MIGYNVEEWIRRYQQAEEAIKKAWEMLKVMGGPYADWCR